MTELRPRPQRLLGESLATARSFVAGALIAPDAERHRTTVLGFLDTHADALHRSCLDGHLTGSALVIDRTRRELAVLLHRKLQIWVQPGGHADGVDDLAAVALTEASEETGIEGLTVLEPAVDIDVHEVRPPGEQPHLHLDVRFVVLAPAGATLARNHESTDLRWITPGDLPALGADGGLQRLASHGFSLLDTSTDRHVSK